MKGEDPRLAIDGGRPVWDGPQPQWPTFARGTARHLAEILESGRVNAWTGGCNRAFEARFAARFGAKHAFAVANGTLALELALAALGVGPGDEVIVPPYTFVSSASCAALLGATPVFCDVGEDHLIDPEKIGALVTPRTKAIVVVHLYGAVAKMDRLCAVARRYGLAIVEDCAQALGATFRGRSVGTLGDVGCFSFCQTKHFTTGGEGGMVITSSARLAERLASLREHGCDMRARLAPRKKGEIRPVSYPRIGFSARMTELQAAIGLGELDRLDRWNLPRRSRFFAELTKGLKGHPLVAALPPDSPARRSSFWLVPFVIRKERLRVSLDRFVLALQAEGAGAYAITWPLLYREGAFAPCLKGRPAPSCPVAERLARSTIGFWVHPTDTLAHIRADLRAFAKVAAAFSY